MSIRGKYKVASIDTFQCLEWIIYKHYAKRVPLIEYSFGLFDLNNILHGIITYGTPSSAPIRGVFKHEFKVIELNRLVINDGLERNCLSFLVSSSLKMLPSPLAVVSYADTSMGHFGYIYQATNFVYTGLSAKRTDWKINGMEHLHGATIADISKGKENRAAYMREVYGDRFYLQDRARKHRYFYFVGNKTQKSRMKELLPYPVKIYPKGECKRYDSSYCTSVQLSIF